MNKFKDFMIRKRFSSRTIEAYTSLVASFTTVLKNRNPEDLIVENNVYLLPHLLIFAKSLKVNLDQQDVEML